MGVKKFVVDLIPGPLIKIFAGPYIAGDNIQAALDTARNLWDQRRICSTIDLLGEELKKDEDVKYAVDVYSRLIAGLGKQEYATISLKPTQLGSHRSTEFCRENIQGIVALAAEHDIKVTLDMEDHAFTDLALEIYKYIRKDFPTFGTVLQSRLFRTDEDIKSLAGLNARVRICIGIYNEPKSVAMTNKNEMKQKLLDQTEVLLKEGHYAEIATHDEAVIDAVMDLIERNSIKKDQFEIQMLMGFPKQVYQNNLVKNDVTVRLYVPFAEKWRYATAYSKRRLAANPAMALYILGNLFQKSTGKK